MQKHAYARKVKDTGKLNALPPDVRQMYLEGVEYHHKLLERLAQR